MLRRIACAGFIYLIASIGTAFAAEVLSAGDHHATVAVDDRPLSADTDHVVAFARGTTLYVCVQDLVQMVSGKRYRNGQVVTIVSFTGTPSSGRYVFTIGSDSAAVNGKRVGLTAPVVESYGRVYIPLSFFGSKAVPTRVKISPDGRTGTIILPN